MTSVQKFDSSEGNVSKYVFEFSDAVAEAVLYKYESYKKRTVLCVSTQSGCPVGCTFCGSGGAFLRNLTADEIVEQVQHTLVDRGIEPFTDMISKFQIMFMSMGEPFLNYENVRAAIMRLHEKYPNADLLVSTIGPSVSTTSFRDFIVLSKAIPKLGLQFSIHRSTDISRGDLIPFAGKMSLIELRNYGVQWWQETGRKVYLNYCVDGTNDSISDFERLVTLFPPNVFAFTFSVVCSADETMKDAGYRELDSIRSFENKFIAAGYDTRVFDPAGQDDIGGGCGQLWYVQQYLRGRNNERGA